MSFRSSEPVGPWKVIRFESSIVEGFQLLMGLNRITWSVIATCQIENSIFLSSPIHFIFLSI
jgi:hypothetical protein